MSAEREPQAFAGALAEIADPDLVIFKNPGYVPGSPGELAARYRAVADEVAAILHEAPGYMPTPCYPLPRLAEALGCEALWFKDEGPRFGLGSFKSAGVAYAMIRQLERELGQPIDPYKAFRGGYRDRIKRVTFATATSGNHGRALAWAAQAVGARCVIYAPTECSDRRIAEMERRGAEVVRTGVIYNPAMDRCRADCARYGWTLFADTSWEDYVDIPTDIMLGYGHIVRELVGQVADWGKITHMMIQGGVGGFAAGLTAGLSLVDPEARITVMVVEPRNIAALQASARAGKPTAIKIDRMSVMTGIANAEISAVAWPTLRERVGYFIGLRDEGVGPCIRFLHAGGMDRTPIELGETATAGMAAFISSLAPGRRAEIGAAGPVGGLVFGCEGVTDRVIYERILTEHAA
jgi:diaminopropionate ammonia-lyase